MSLPQNELLNKRVSVLMDGLGKKEAWTGIVRHIDDEWMMLEGRKAPNDPFDCFFVRLKAILSIARYTSAEWGGTYGKSENTEGRKL